MRSLLKLIKKYQLFLIFLILQVVSFFLIFSYNSFQKSTILSTTNGMVGAAAKKSAEISNFFSLKEINEQLVAENNRLRENSKLSFEKVNDEFALIDDSLWRKQYRFFYADVVQATIYNKNNFITLDKGFGTNNDIKVGMGVISDNSVVGKVIKCTKNYSLVMPIIHSQFQLNVISQRTGNSGLLKWTEENDFRYANVMNITKDTPLKVGDVFVTRTGSNKFPGGIEIGVIEEITSDEGDNFHTIRLLLKTDFSKLKKATLVYNLFKDELDELEEAMDEDG